MQSARLSYARYMFYQSIGIEINEDNYKMLFMPQIRFEGKYGKTKKDLLSLYSYDGIGTTVNKKIRSM